jgi:hypothetical protein
MVMDMVRVNEYWQVAAGTLQRLRSGRQAGCRARGRTNRLRRFGPHTAMIRQRLADLDSIRQASLSRR